MENLKEIIRIYIVYLFLFLIGIGCYHATQADLLNQDIIYKVLSISLLASYFMTMVKIKIDRIVDQNLGILNTNNFSEQEK